MSATYLKPSEAAKYLEISEAELERAFLAGKGPRRYVKGPLVRYAQADLDHWVAELMDDDPSKSEGWTVVDNEKKSAAPIARKLEASDVVDWEDAESGYRYLADGRVLDKDGNEIRPGRWIGSGGRILDASGKPVAVERKPSDAPIHVRDAIEIPEFGRLEDPGIGIPQHLLAGVESTPGYLVEAARLGVSPAEFSGRGGSPLPRAPESAPGGDSGDPNQPRADPKRIWTPRGSG